jgi:transketolase
VVSMPSFRIFEEQGEEYIDSIFPRDVPKISVEAGATMGWWKYIGRDGIAIGVDRFGASAPGPIVMEKLGVSVGHIVNAAKKLVKK